MIWIRKTFVRGILLILPVAITFVIIRWLFRLVTGFSTAAAEALLRYFGSPAARGALIDYLTPVLALGISVGVVLVIGVVGGNYVGKRTWASLEAFVLRLPIVGWFYGSARQLMDAFRMAGRGAFREVVLVEYPRRGIWCLGFVTAPAIGLVPETDSGDHLYVFLPTTPNPTSGYTIVVPRRDAVVLPITVDEGLKVIFSAGFISPVPRGGARP